MSIFLYSLKNNLYEVLYKNFEPTNNFLLALIEKIENLAILKVVQNDLKNIEHFVKTFF